MSNQQDPVELINAKYRSNLLALVSHELNTPLTGIINAISVLENEQFESPGFFEMLKRNTERLRVTVDSLLELANADAGALRVHLTEASLENLIQAKEKYFRSFLSGHGFALQTVIEDQLPKVCIDPIRLGRALATLIEHAVMLADKSANSANENLLRIEVSLAPIDSISQLLSDSNVHQQAAMFLTIGVTTTTPTIGDVSRFEDFFEPFNPWRDVYTRDKDGIGVELALAKEILIAHKGFIGVDYAEKPKEGWVFRMGVPVLSHEDELREVIDNRIHSGVGRLSKTSILLLRPQEATLKKIGGLQTIEQTIPRLLYRSSDSVFSIPSLGEITIVMDDCNFNGASKLGNRLAKELKQSMPELEFVWGTATGPDNGATAEELLCFVRKATSA